MAELTIAGINATVCKTVGDICGEMHNVAGGAARSHPTTEVGSNGRQLTRTHRFSDSWYLL